LVRTKLNCLTQRSSGTAQKARSPLSFALDAMRNLPVFPVSPVAVFAAGWAAGSGVVASHLVGWFERALPVRLFSRAACFGVPRSSWSRSFLRLVQPVLGAAVFCCLGLLRSVAVSASNPALKRDCAKARSPLASR